MSNAIDELISHFEGLEIKKSRVHEFMKEECCIMFKQATLYSKKEMVMTILSYD